MQWQPPSFWRPDSLPGGLWPFASSSTVEGSCLALDNCIVRKVFFFFKVLVAQSCPTLCDPMDHSPPGSSVHRILQARTLEWVAMLSSRGSSQPRSWTSISCIVGRLFTESTYFIVFPAAACRVFAPLCGIFHCRARTSSCGVWAWLL